MAARPYEREALAAIRYQANTVYLHSDLALMPR
jgi:predicted NAD/FAD-binding protein